MYVLTTASGDGTFRRCLSAFCWLVLLMALAACGPAQQEQAGGPPEAEAEARPPDRMVPTAPFRIIGNIYYVGQTDNSLPGTDDASYLITTPQGHVLLDTGAEHTVAQIQANVAELGFELQDIKFLIHSHSHSDHVSGDAAMIQAIPGMQLWVMEGDAEVVESGGEADFDTGRRRFSPAAVDRVLQDGDTLEIGGTGLVANHTAGHTKGCTSWSTAVEEDGETYGILFFCSTGITERTVLVDNPRYPEIAEDFKRTFARLRAMEPDVFLAAHGNFFNLEEKARRLHQGVSPNPFIDPAGYAAYLEKAEAAFLAAYEEQGGEPQ